MKAFHGDVKIKRKYLARVSAHQKADAIVKGQYWHDGKGCAVGCTIHSGDHGAYETELGIPRLLAQLEDGIFEALPNELAKTWPKRFLAAIKPGADLSNIWPQFAVWLLTDEEFGVLQFAKTDAQKESIQAISDMYLMKLAGADIDPNDWREARQAAYDIYAADARTAAAYATYAAADAAYAISSTYTIYAAAYAADAAYAAYAARAKLRVAQSKKLIELLKAAV